MKKDVYNKRVPVQRHTGTYMHFKSEKSRKIEGGGEKVIL